MPYFLFLYYILLCLLAIHNQLSFFAIEIEQKILLDFPIISKYTLSWNFHELYIYLMIRKIHNVVMSSSFRSNDAPFCWRLWEGRWVVTLLKSFSDIMLILHKNNMKKAETIPIENGFWRLFLRRELFKDIKLIHSFAWG